MPRYDAVLFDLDGTLLNTITDIHEAMNHSLSAFGYPPQSMDETRAYVGNGRRMLITRSLPAGASEAEIEAVMRVHSDYYDLHCEDHTAPYPGIPELLTALKDGGVKAGCVTNKAERNAAPMMERYFADRILLTRGNVPGRPVKPAPDAALDAMAALGAAKERTLFVGDSGPDYYTAKNTGLDCVLVSWGYRDRAELESYGVPVIDRAEELLNYIF